MAIGIVQTATAESTATKVSSLAATWGATTKQGNLLFACLSLNLDGSGPPTVTAPSGWQPIGSPGLAPDIESFGYFIDPGHSTARSGSESFSWTGGSGSNKAVLCICELSGHYLWPGRADENVGGGNSGTADASPPDTNVYIGDGASPITAKLPWEMIFCLAASRGAVDYSAASGFTIIAQQKVSGGGSASTKISNLIGYFEHTGGGSVPQVSCTQSSAVEYHGQQHHHPFLRQGPVAGSGVGY